MGQGVSESRFYMWRTLFAVAHADNVVTDEEIEFMAHVLEDIDFSDQQTTILKDDIVNAKNIIEMFKGITTQEDRMKFFEFARDLVWVDGDFGSEEQSVMIKLAQMHFEKTNVDDLIGKITLELEDEPKEEVSDHDDDGHSSGLRHMLSAFKDRFLRAFRG